MTKKSTGVEGFGDKLKRAFQEKGETIPASVNKAVTRNKASGKQEKRWEKTPIRRGAVLARNQQRYFGKKPKKKATVRKSRNLGLISAASQRKILENKVVQTQRGLNPETYRISKTEADCQTGNGGTIDLLAEPVDISVNQEFFSGAGSRYEPSLEHAPDCWLPIPVEQRKANPRVLRLGLDMGTSATKVVILDVARGDIAWAIPFCNTGPNPYLLPTSIEWVDDQPVVSGQSDARRPFKWRLINDDLDHRTLAEAGAYLALVLRHVVAWIHGEHGDYYSNSSLVWEVRVGLPAASAENSTLCRTYQGLLALAVKIASTAGAIQREVVETEARKTLHDLRSGNDIPVDSYFKESGMVLPTQPTPEIAANIAGFFRSRRWDSRKPYGLLVDVGASTLDCAFCTFQDRNGNTSLSEFTRGVESLGVFRLHDARVDWIIDQLEANDDCTQEDVERIFDSLTSVAFDLPIPSQIEGYLENARIANSPTDKNFNIQLGETVGHANLITGAKRFFATHIPGGAVIPVYTSGGGSRHVVYQSFLRNMSANRNSSWSLRVEPLGIPSFVEAPLIHEDQRDRLAVAYGLCADEKWRINYPDGIEDFTVERRDFSDRYVSSEQM